MENATAPGFMLQTMLYLVNYNTTTFNSSIFNTTITEPADTDATKCYGVYGCFPITYPWSSSNRPNSAYPFSPNYMDIKFPAYNRKNSKVPRFIDINDPDTIFKVGFHSHGHVYFVTHGFLESGNAPWIAVMRDALLEHDPHATVVVIDWKGGSSPPYLQAAANIRVVGAITAHIIFSIYEELKLKDLSRFHMIGHSLGAHLCGYAGYHLQRDFDLKIARITAMDPAEPFFANTDEIVRLDQSDAKYVDVIHSDIAVFVRGGFGMKQTCGHVDFYPNGGHSQPGCEHQGGKISCNHQRSIELLIESINTKCPYQSIICESYVAFQHGNCSACDRDGHFCIKFGFHSYQSYKALFDKGYYSSSPIVTYLRTADESPFCRQHYKVTVKISNSEESRQHNGEVGLLYLKLKSLTSGTDKIQLNESPIYFEPGKEFKFFTIGADLKDARQIKVEYKFKQTLINPLTWRIFTPRIYVEFIEIESMETQKRMKICPSFKMPVKQDADVEFREEACEIP